MAFVLKSKHAAYSNNNIIKKLHVTYDLHSIPRPIFITTGRFY